MTYHGICTRCGRWIWAATAASTSRWRWATSASYPCRVEDGVAEGPSCQCPPVEEQNAREGEEESDE